MLLNKAELLEKYYTRGNPIDDADVDLYLSRANTWCIGYIGGVPLASRRTTRPPRT